MRKSKITARLIAFVALASLLSACAAGGPELGMAVEDFDQACFESDRARGRLVFSDSNREVWYCDLWDTHYVFEDGILVSIEQELPADSE